MKSTSRVFAALLLVLLVVFIGGWYALALGPDNPVPWAIMSVWSDTIMVGMAAEQLLGYIPHDGRSLSHAVLVIGSATLFWAVLFTLIFVGMAWCVRLARKLLPSTT